MSLTLPEFAIRDGVEESIELMLANEALILNDMLAERPQAERDSYATALADRKGKVRLGWSAENIEDWSVIVLKSKDVPHPLIGMRATRPSEDPVVTRVLATAIDAGGDIVLAFTNGTPVVGDDAGEIAATGLLRIDNEIVTYIIDAGECRVTNRGVRETAAVAHASGVPVTFFETSQRVGWRETEILRVDVLSSNPPFAMVLARMIQAFLVRANGIFVAKGYAIDEISSGDIEGRPQFYPHRLFLRSLTIKMTTAMSLPESYPVITGTAIDLTVEQAA